MLVDNPEPMRQPDRGNNGRSSAPKPPIVNSPTVIAAATNADTLSDLASAIGGATKEPPIVREWKGSENPVAVGNNNRGEPPPVRTWTGTQEPSLTVTEDDSERQLSSDEMEERMRAAGYPGPKPSK